MKLADLVRLVEEAGTDPDTLFANLKFLETTKRWLEYSYVPDASSLHPLSYTVKRDTARVETETSDGHEVGNSTGVSGDITMSGPSNEKYVIKAAKFPGLYHYADGSKISLDKLDINQKIVPDQSKRWVAAYAGVETTFTCSWGEQMVVKPGDYVVHEGPGKYYRIAKAEYEITYNPPGKSGK